MFSVTCFLSLSLLFVFSFERSIRFHLFTAEAARRWWPRNVEAESWPMRRQGTGQSGRSVKIFMRWYILWTYYSCIYSTHDDYLLTSCWSLKQTFNCIFLVPKGPAPSRDIQDIKTVTQIVALQVHEILGISSDAKNCVIWISIKTCPSSDPHGISTKECAEGTIPGREERPSTPGKGD